METLVLELEKICDAPDNLEYTLNELENAKDAVLSMHMPIVIDMAFKVASKFHLKSSMEDLIEAGKVGLQNAFESFIPILHGEFSNHCLWYVKSAMSDLCRMIEFEHMEKQQIHCTLSSSWEV